MRTVQTVWKEKLALKDVQTVIMPCDTKVLCFQNQAGSPTIWFQCSPDAPKNSRTFIIVGTSHAIPEGRNTYIGTAQFGPLVFHCFEVTP